jgi:hypothetical protein
MVPLVLLLLDKLSYKFALLIPLSMVIVICGSYFGVNSQLVSYHNQEVDFEKRMYTEFHDLYGKAVEDKDEKGCLGCEEAYQYFVEEYNKLPDNIKPDNFNTHNDLRYRDCLETIAYLTENISICDYIAEIDMSEGPGSPGEQCKKAVQALIADDVSLCNGGDECTTIFAIMTDNPSLCDQLPYYDIDNCHARYNNSREDPYNYQGLFWRPPGD